MSKLILASASPIRARLLEQARISFEVHAADIDEAGAKTSLLAQGADGPAIAGRLAELKALPVCASNSGALVLGADQLLMFDGKLVSKCADMAQAGALLRQLRSGRHDLITGAVLSRDGVTLWRHVDSASLWMREFSDDFLSEYLAAEGGDILSSVGCYRLEGRGSQLFERIEGDYFSILGLPLLPLLAALREQGVIVK